MRQGAERLLEVPNGLAMADRAMAFSPACRKYCTACGSRRPRTQCSARGRRQVTGLRAEALRQACPNPGMPPGLASRRDALIQEVLIQGHGESQSTR